jgi:hypothetical protein
MRLILFTACLCLTAGIAAAGTCENKKPADPATASSGSASQQKHESGVAADLRKEEKEFSDASPLGCVILLFTGNPLHIAAGSLAPQNGFAGGVAFGHAWDVGETWSFNWDSDAVASANGSWRAGAYLTAVWEPNVHIQVLRGRQKADAAGPDLGLKRATTFHIYAQSISLKKLTYFGLGPSTSDTARSYYGMQETIIGGNVTRGFWAKVNASVAGELNGRIVNINPAAGQTSPTIGALYTDATAPGLGHQPIFTQFGETFRIRPDIGGGALGFNYSVRLQQYLSRGYSNSFQRFTLDLEHTIPLAKTTRKALRNGELYPSEFNSPDSCGVGHKENERACQSYTHRGQAITKDRDGTIGFRFLLVDSIVPSGNMVPFYYQPTLGGSDINGNSSLASYQDYRFRAPDLMLVRGSFEHSVWGPIGFMLNADAGKVGLHPTDVGTAPWIHSFSAGLTLRAGGIPAVSLSIAWGGHEGMHTIANVSPTLLGGSSRPSLY